MTRLAILVPVLLSAAFLPQAALAQDSGEKVNQLIVYGNDPCPVPEDGSITVCARKDEAERFRIPEPLREAVSPQNDAWNNKVIAYETIGASGTLSCSPSGPGGAFGCTQKLIDAAYAERRTSDVQFSTLIQAEREKRLATIDQDAAETQARVEQIEREYDERRRREAGDAGPAASMPAAATTRPAPAQ